MEWWQYCGKCRKPIILDYLPDCGTISKELDKLEARHQTHLCSVCPQNFATCKAQNITFGNCVGNDNVLHCNLYTEAKIESLIEEYSCNPNDWSLSAFAKEIINIAKEVRNEREVSIGGRL